MSEKVQLRNIVRFKDFDWGDTYPPPPVADLGGGLGGLNPPPWAAK